ncbi:MAG: hypothetical protein ACRC42_04710 [Mycoplasma sp.]
MSQTSQDNHQQLFFGKKFGAYFRIDQIIMRYEDEKNESDIFTKEYLVKLFEVQNNIISRQIQFMGENMTVFDLCYKPIAGKGCMMTSPTNFWKDDLETMWNDTDIKETAKCLQTGISGDMPCFDNIGTPIQWDAIFGIQGCEGGEEKSECVICRKTARSFSLTFLWQNDFYTNKASELWEKEVFEDEINKFNQREKESKSGLKMYYMAERSVPDEWDIENRQNIWIVGISYTVMFVYISVMMGEFPSLILSRIWVGLGGIVVVILSCLGSFALVSWLGIKQSLISAEVVPFWVLAIGVDNMFIITGARDKKANKILFLQRQGYEINNISNEEQIGWAIKEVGPSITTAAWGECLSFLVGYLTDIPALQSFCLCATFAVIINYFLQMSMFVAFVSLDDERVKSRRYDVLPCIKVSQSKQVEHSIGKVKLQNFVSGRYYDFLWLLPVQIIILIIYIAMVVVSCIAVINFPLGLNQQTTVVQGGDWFNYFKTQEKYVDVGSPAYLVWYNIDYSNETNWKLIDQMSDHLSTLSTVQPPVYSWFKDYQKFMNKYYSDECNKNIDELSKQPIANRVREFLKMPTDHFCCKTNAICGEPYMGDISFNENGEIEASRFRFAHVPLVNQSVFVNSVIQATTVTRSYSDLFTLMPGKNRTKNFILNGETVDISTAFPYSLFYAYYYQYLFIRGISIQNFLIGFATIFLAVQWVMNLKSAFVVVLFVFSCVLNLIGMWWLLNYLPDFIIELNAISVVNIVVACGWSVEFCAHLIIFYSRSSSNDSKERVRYSLKNVGVSVLIGIIVTKIIGVFVLLFAPSKVFQIYYFRMYFFLILVGFFHGFMLLPLFLTYVNIKGTDTNAKDNLNKICLPNEQSDKEGLMSSGD